MRKLNLRECECLLSSHKASGAEIQCCSQDIIQLSFYPLSENGMELGAIGTLPRTFQEHY
jgi:hypothetical protein